MREIGGLRIIFSIFFPNRQGVDSETKVNITFEDICKLPFVRLEHCCVTFEKCTAEEISGELIMYNDNITVYTEKYTIKSTDKVYISDSVGICYDAYASIKLCNVVKDDLKERIDKIQYAETSPTATKEEIKEINRQLKSVGIRPIPFDLEMFYYNVSGDFNYNGRAIFGTTDEGIVGYNITCSEYYTDYDYLFFIGMVDDDIYTYNYQSRKYESRDINGFEVWDEYDDFDMFFIKEVLSQQSEK